MAFVDNLAFSLFAISLAGFMFLYTILSIYVSYLKEQKNYYEDIRTASIPILFIGIYLLLMGLWGQFTWPLPGSYNILFYDPMIAFALVMLSFAGVSRVGGNMEYVGFMALIMGVMAIAYGIQGYFIGLTTQPIALLALFFLYGFAGVLAYPVTIIAQKKPGSRKNPWGGWTAIIILFSLSLFIASCLSGFIGLNAVASHLVTPP